MIFFKKTETVPEVCFDTQVNLRIFKHRLAVDVQLVSPKWKCCYYVITAIPVSQYTGVLPAWMSVCHVHTCAPGGQKRALDP